MTPLSLHLVALDSWGDAVAEGLPDAAVSSGRDLSPWPPARCHVVVTAREDVQFFREVDAFAVEWSLVWTPLVLTPRGVRLGPVVVPGRSACYHCFLRRWLQHDRQLGDTRAWLRSVADDAARSVPGWLPSDLLIAGGLAAALGGPTGEGPGPGSPVVGPGVDQLGGTVTSYDGISGTIARDRVIGVHGCPRCRRRPDRSSDTWSGLALAFPPAAVGENEISVPAVSR